MTFEAIGQFYLWLTQGGRWDYVLFLALLYGSGIYAIGWGGWPERWVGCAFVVASWMTEWLLRPGIVTFVSLQTTTFAVDIALLIVLLAIALNADRRWPLLVTALHAMSVISHVAKFLDPDLNKRIYATMLIFWSYPGLLVLIIGTWRHRKRVALGGPEPDWTQRATGTTPSATLD